MRSLPTRSLPRLLAYTRRQLSTEKPKSLNQQPIETDSSNITTSTVVKSNLRNHLSQSATSSQPTENAITRARKNTQPTVYSFSGLSYAMPYFMAWKRFKVLLWNVGLGSSIAGFALFVYKYSIWAVKQDDLTDEYLQKVEQDQQQQQQALLMLSQQQQKQ